MKNVKVFMADGLEEVEALTAVDLLRRAGITVDTVSITGDKLIHGAHGIDIMADELFEDTNAKTADMLILPGGMPGTAHLNEHQGLEQLLREFYQEKKYIAAICAAPGILGKLGFLKGRQTTSYPSEEGKLLGAQVVREPAVISDHIITSRGVGTAIDFSLTIISELISKEKADEISASIIYG